MTDLEQRLASLERRLDFPDAEIRSRVWAAIAARRTRRRRRTSLVLAFAIVLVAFGPAIALHSARHGILRALGIHDTSPTIVARPTSVTVTLGDGERTTLAKATKQLSFRPIVPTSLPRPLGVYVGTSLSGGTLTLLFDVGGRQVRLREFRGDVESAAGKAVSVRGQPGVWLAGANEFAYRDPSGKRQKVHVEPPGNTLLWQKGNLTLQLEAIGMTQTYAVALARTVV